MFSTSTTYQALVREALYTSQVSQQSNERREWNSGRLSNLPKLNSLLRHNLHLNLFLSFSKAWYSPICYILRRFHGGFMAGPTSTLAKSTIYMFTLTSLVFFFTIYNQEPYPSFIRKKKITKAYKLLFSFPSSRQIQSYRAIMKSLSE